MTSVPEVYELNLASSGKLKLRATARLAEGGPGATFDACVLLHEAARIERRAIDALPLCPPATRLAASVEECFCLLEGRDPPGAAQVWGRILREQGEVDPATAEALLSRLKPRYDKSSRAFAKVMTTCTTLWRHRHPDVIASASLSERTRAMREVRRVLSDFPGVSTLWWTAYRLAEEKGEMEAAWDALSKARLLSPDNPRFDAMSLLLSVWVLPRQDADIYIGRARSGLDKAGAEVCLMYAHAEIELAKRGDAEERWRRALEATLVGLVRARTEGLRKNLHATQLILDSLLAGRRPTLEILYLAGLGEMAASAPPKSNVVALVAQMARARAMESQDAAA